MTGKTWKKWTEKEDTTLLNAVKRHPGNLAYAFAIVSKRLNRSEASCSKRYYHSLKDKSVVLTTISEKKATANNQKVTPRKKKDESTPVVKSKWKRILAILAE